MPGNLVLTPSQRVLQASARKFAVSVLAEAKNLIKECATAEERFLATKPIYENMVAAGYLCKCIPTTVGGERAGLIDAAVILEELYSVDASVTLTLVGTVLGLSPVIFGGTPNQCERLLKPFLSKRGAPLAAFCSTEAGGSANVASPPPGEGVRTIATLRDDKWIIDGQKKWVSSATGWKREGADLLCIVCRTNPEASPQEGISIIAVERPSRGLVFERAIESVGHHGHLTPQFQLQNVIALRKNLLGEEGKGLALGAASFLSAAALVGIFGVALMRAAFDFTLQFARFEKRGGIQPIIEHQAVGYALAKAKMSVETARSLSWRACQAIETGAPAAEELANYSKVYGSETAVSVITDLMRVVGIESYDREVPLAGLLQDALALPIFAGGNLGVRMRRLHSLLMAPDYDPLSTI